MSAEDLIIGFEKGVDNMLQWVRAHEWRNTCLGEGLTKAMAVGLSVRSSKQIRMVAGL